MKVAPAAADTLNVVKEKVVEAAHAGADKAQEVYNEYVAPAAHAGIEKTQEVFNEYVAPAAQAGIEKTQEVYNEYVAPAAHAGAEIVKVYIMNASNILLLMSFLRKNYIKQLTF